MKRYAHALVRPPAATFDQAIRPEGNPEPIDVALARRQHDAYVEVLEAHVGSLTRVTPDDAYPDCCFIEDPCFVVGRYAFVAPMAATSRDGEASEVAEAVGAHREVVSLTAPATADGGDVMVCGQRVFMGISSRTNAAAVEQVRRVLDSHVYDVIPVPVRDVLHLKSACTAIGMDTVVAAPGMLDEALFDGLRLLHVPADEAYAANCLDLGTTVVVSEGYEDARRVIEYAGFPTTAVGMSEFRKAGGSLTCLSILL